MEDIIPGTYPDDGDTKSRSTSDPPQGQDPDTDLSGCDISRSEDSSRKRVS